MKKVLFLVNHDYTVYNTRLEIVERLLKEGYQVRRGQREGWLRLTIPMAQDGAVMRGILKQFMN